MGQKVFKVVFINDPAQALGLNAFGILADFNAVLPPDLVMAGGSLDMH